MIGETRGIWPAVGTVVMAALLLLAAPAGALGAAVAGTADGGQASLATTNDQFEPNDDSGSAAAIGSGSYTGLTAEADGEDWYAVEVDEGEELSAHIAYDESVARPTLAILEPSNFGGPDEVNVVENPDGNDSIGATFDESGTYYVRVAGDDQAVGYDLTVDVSANGTAGKTDQFEPDGSASTGSLIGSGTYEDILAESGDDDYFRVEVEAGQELSAHIAYDETTARPTLAILEPSNFGGPDEVNVVESPDGNDSVGATFDERGTYFVRVRGGEADVRYDLTVDVSANGTAGKTDQFEPDGSASTGSLIGSGTYENVLAESEDEDWFRVEVDEGEELSAHIAYDETVARPTLAILQPSDFGGPDEVNVVENPDGNDSIGATFDGPGTYFVRVSGGEADVRYDLTVDVSENGTAGVMDEFEPDGSPDTASLVGSGTYEDLFVEPNGADYFAVDLRQGEELSAHIAYDETTAKPALAVYDQNGDRVRGVENPDGNDSVGLRAGSTGTYYVGVTGGDAEIRYDLTIDADENGTAGVVDRFEPNGVPSTASTIEPGTLRNLVAEDGESDFYAVPVESGSVLSARLQYDETEGQPGLAFYDDDEERIEQFNATNATGDDILNATISSGGTYYVEITGGDVDVDYELTVSTGDEPIAPTPTPSPTPTPMAGDDDGDDDGDDGSEDAGSDGEDGDGDSGDGESGDGEDGADEETSGGSGPGFGVAALVTALLAFALLARRRG